MDKFEPKQLSIFRLKKNIDDPMGDHRTPFEKDYDRLLYSTPVRRLADKTQVFPLDKNDSIRTRLTHSHEVANLASSMGKNLIRKHSEIFSNIENPESKILPILSTIGLMHDLGNPPFGHGGEKAISHWFEKKFKVAPDLTQDEINDFLKFEGNAQAFRLVTKLQSHEGHGLDLTCATLAASIKYPTFSNETNDDIGILKKFNIFQSEKNTIEKVWEKVDLKKGKRHPLTYIMEACDDIAYSIFDIEDSIKKGLFTYHDIIEQLESANLGKEVQGIIKKSKEKHIEYRSSKLTPTELGDVSMQRLRTYCIGYMIEECTQGFFENINSYLDGTEQKSLSEKSECHSLIETLKDFASVNSYKHKSVVEQEIIGYKTIHNILDYLDAALSGIKAIDTGGKNKLKKDYPYSVYIYSLISNNYRREFESHNNAMSTEYKKCQLMTDMVSGMTDNFAIDFSNELERTSGKFFSKEIKK